MSHVRDYLFNSVNTFSITVCNFTIRHCAHTPKTPHRLKILGHKSRQQRAGPAAHSPPALLLCYAHLFTSDDGMLYET